MSNTNKETTSTDIRYEHHGPVRLITINRPEKMNSLDFDANDALIDCWESFRDDDEARVAVLTGIGNQAFCAGADLKTYTMNFATRPAPEFRQRFTDGFGLGGITRGLKINKPILAAVNGYAISGGLEIALACDLRFASTHAQFGLQDVKWGFHACDGALVRLKDIIGMGHTMELVLSGDLIEATHAARIGLVNRLFAPEALLDASMDYAQKLATRAPLAQQLAKDVITRIEGLSLDEALKLESASFHNLANTDDLKEGTDAFAQKRDAKFKGR